MDTLIDPPWYDADEPGDYSDKAWDYATSMGRSSGALSTMPWAQLEPILQSLWLDMLGYPPWEESRVPMYRAWRKERLLHPDATRKPIGE